MVGWALINFFCLQDGRLFEVGANSRLGANSNKNGNIQCTMYCIFIRDLKIRGRGARTATGVDEED